VGLARITTGNKVFGAMKGAVDAGVHIPHSVKKFPGFKKTKGNKKGDYNSEAHSLRIHGGHVDSYMDQMEETNKAKAEKHFAQWDKCLEKNKCETVSALFDKVLTAIKKNCARVKSTKKATKPVRKGDMIVSGDKKWERKKRLSKEKKREQIKVKIAEVAKKLRDAK